MTIWGWAALEEYTKLSDQTLRRAIGHYGFPKPIRVRKGSRFANVWEQPLVSEWLRRNHMLYFMEDRRRKLARQQTQGALR